MRETPTLIGTPKRMAQVASNLIGNALKHGDQATAVRVRLDCTRQNQITLQVRNSGTIPDTLIPYLFDPFRGGHRQPGRSEGLGLGLYIVSQIVQAHGGNRGCGNRQRRLDVFYSDFAARCVRSRIIASITEDSNGLMIERTLGPKLLIPKSTA